MARTRRVRSEIGYVGAPSSIRAVRCYFTRVIASRCIDLSGAALLHDLINLIVSEAYVTLLEGYLQLLSGGEVQLLEDSADLIWNWCWLSTNEPPPHLLNAFLCRAK